mmetsp:Transcript_44487/g.127488  ORF Transcript_44487/g.127488 Transcript_44487/m.127488 type:complete len:537 (+) Transcript_44487:75-1685(+)|eukprot:CAMPEP_0177165506 /NCGR_PEP_ID=MMETSP0367-20130122/7539_1 /TAXON_ID=447022 ORGANISM="Scrippsiella hangoei-like, Strain SHHI-4" /NCGR_SAMPLE_ID=MMETSP0367 /ASSEMBLY_ACC=CAM_ASM_000362 /LENGTH=536 /DNA_ID=CAMNT_0018611517 /DNA_START=70 /DNA_END=1680 /DNA_ORIENTATION=-
MTSNEQPEINEDGDGGRGKGRRGRGKGRGKGRGGHADGSDGSGDMPPWVGPPSPNAAVLEGEWTDSLGHAVFVEAGPRRRGPLMATLSRSGKEQTLSLRCDSSTGAWACGNAVMDLNNSGPSCLVWVTSDGRRSVWLRPEGQGGGGAAQKMPDLMPWLLMPDLPGKNRGGPLAPAGTANEASIGSTGGGKAGRRRWASILEEEAEDEDLWNQSAKGEVEQKNDDKEETTEASASSGAATGSHNDNSVAVDSSRIAALLDVRQVFGNDRNAQEVLSHILMDHDLLRRDGEDAMVPSLDSPLWERLSELPRRNALQRLASFKAGDRGFLPETAPDFSEVRCGRHRFPVAATDLQALIRRWSGPNDMPQRVAAMAHVVSLYRILENPLNPYWERSSMQLGWDSVQRKKAGVEYELFASPFNARVENGHYCSRWPHAEALFGSLGAYPDVIDKIPTSAIVGINPPFSEAYLDHVIGKSLDTLVNRFKRVHLTIPVREAPWRSQLHRLKGASFVKQFWDSTALSDKALAQPVLYWEGSELG